MHIFFDLLIWCRYERQRMTLEGQASNIGATAFAVSNIETQKQIVCEYTCFFSAMNVFGFSLLD